MGVAHRTAGRILSKGYTGGKANGTLAMDRLPFNGMLMTSSLNSLITDSAPGAHNYSTGNKTNNGMEGVFPDNTSAADDNPRDRAPLRVDDAQLPAKSPGSSRTPSSPTPRRRRSSPTRRIAATAP